ncbi:MAG: hypothetical protein K6G22_14340 [Lachnospiraceae bacterium]|nr:hypothetical protein [Lachnospiraceae bacterium]
MPNIFDGISKLSDTDLRNQIATLEEVTMSNVFGQMGNTITNKAASAFRFVRKSVTGKETKVPPIVKIEDRINNKSIELRSLNRDELEKRIREVLVKKVNSGSLTYLQDPSDDRLSVEVIELAVKSYKKDKINPNLTYAQKADIIRHRYDERMLSQMQEKLNNQTAEEKKQTEAAIQKEIDSMSEERREELRKALNVEKLNGEMVRKMFASTAGVSATLVAMESAGFGAYIALTTVMHAVFTTFLGVTLPFAAYTGATTFLSIITGPVGIAIAGGVELLMINKNKNKIIYELAAQIVWLAVSTYGHKFTPNEEELPSWLPSMERDRETKEIQTLHNMIQEEEKLKEDLANHKKALSDAQNAILKNEYSIQKYQDESKSAQEKLEEQKKENERLRSEHDAAVSNLNKMKNDAKASEEELLRAKNSVNDLERAMSLKDREISDLYDLLQKDEDKIDELQKVNAESEITIQKNNEDIGRLEKEVESSKKNTDKKWSKSAEDLKIRWMKFYKTLDFDLSVFKDVVKNFEYNEFTDIEMKLRELDDAKDKRAVSNNRGKVGGDRCHVGFSTPSGFPSRIFFRELKGAPKGRTAIITDIVKHNDSRYEALCK